MSDSLWPHGLFSSWNSPGHHTGVGSHSLLWRIFPTQELNQGLLYSRWLLLLLSGNKKKYNIFWLHRENTMYEESCFCFKLMCDFSGPIIGNYKGFTWQASLGKLPSPYQNWSIASGLQPLRGAAVKDSKPPQFSSVQSLSRVRLCDPMNHSTPGLPIHHQLPEFIQTHVYRVSDAIQPSHPLSSPSPPAPNPSQHQSLFPRVNSSHEVAKVLEFWL